MTDITEIITAIVKIIIVIVGSLLIPYIKERINKDKREKIAKWIDIAVNAAEEAARAGLIDKKSKYEYAKNILEKQGITFDADTTQAVIDSAVYQCFNQFREMSVAGEKSE